MRRPRIRARSFLVLGVLGLLGVLLAGSLPADRGDRLEEAADLSQFRAGDIISDAMFFDGWAMSAPQVQAFLDAKGKNCVDGAMPCLRRYTETSLNMPADGRCNGYVAAANETAASIITRVGQSCGISQRVLLVLLQKEQSLVTGTRPSLRQYQAATGAGCPDTAPCDPNLAGFFNQVYNAAWKFKNYAATASTRNYRAGRWNTVLYHPNASCGSGQVYILNQATAGLYVYTPYQPNQAALRAGYGTGDGCSAYGNRNFFSYFTDWFGSTHEPGAAAISDAYYRAGPDSIGAPLRAPVCGLTGGGCLQEFQQATIYWSPGTGAHVMRGGIRNTWGETGWEFGSLGYPVEDEAVAADGIGRFQQFQGGWIFWSPNTGAQVVRGAIVGTWFGLQAERGVYGYPTSWEMVTADGVGRVQRFQGGSIFWSPATGAQAIRGGMFATWAALGGDTGVLGYPTSGEAVTPDGVGRVQSFQGGTMYWSPSTGAQPVRGGMLATYQRLGLERGDLGYPVGQETLAADGTSVVQEFQGGTIHWSAATEGHAVLDALADGFTTRGGVTGLLGLPVAEQRSLPGGVIRQDFRGGVLYQLGPSQSVVVRGGMLATHRRYDADAGPLGLPVSDEQTVGSAQVQAFQSGSIYWTADGGAHPVRGGIGGAWLAGGGLSGPLGAPTSDEAVLGRGVLQRFTGGAIYWTSTAVPRQLGPETLAGWIAAGGPTGLLGEPVADEVAQGAAKRVDLQNGSIYWTAAGGAHVVRGGIGGAWLAGGGLSGPLGAPTSDEAVLGRGVVQRFTGGAIYWTSTAVPRQVGTETLAAWIAAGGPTGILGEPVADEVAQGAARRLDLQGGSIYWTPGNGAHVVRGGVGGAWLATGGLSGPLGAPVGGEVDARPGRSQDFVGGTVYWSEATGGRAVRTDLRDAYVRAGGTGSALGFPTADEQAVGATRVQAFQSGSIYWTTAGGAHPVRGGIGGVWLAGGGLSGPLGAPTSDEELLGAGVVQRFTGGGIYWTTTAVGRRLGNDVLAAWIAAGGPTGTLGEPLSSEYVRDGEPQVDFQHGRIVVRNGVAEVVPG